jgi:AbrB family looped-hinge helix DNA binding protein
MANLTRVKDKFQITIPVALRTATALQLGDYLEATQFEDGILLRPQRRAGLQASPRGSWIFCMKRARFPARAKRLMPAWRMTAPHGLDRQGGGHGLFGH